MKDLVPGQPGRGDTWLSAAVLQCLYALRVPAALHSQSRKSASAVPQSSALPDPSSTADLGFLHSPMLSEPEQACWGPCSALPGLCARWQSLRGLWASRLLVPAAQQPQAPSGERRAEIIFLEDFVRQSERLLVQRSFASLTEQASGSHARLRAGMSAGAQQLCSLAKQLLQPLETEHMLLQGQLNPHPSAAAWGVKGHPTRLQRLLRSPSRRAFKTA